MKKKTRKQLQKEILVRKRRTEFSKEEWKIMEEELYGSDCYDPYEVWKDEEKEKMEKGNLPVE